MGVQDTPKQEQIPIAQYTSPRTCGLLSSSFPHLWHRLALGLFKLLPQANVYSVIRLDDYLLVSLASATGQLRTLGPDRQQRE